MIQEEKIEIQASKTIRLAIEYMHKKVKEGLV